MPSAAASPPFGGLLREAFAGHALAGARIALTGARSAERERLATLLARAGATVRIAPPRTRAGAAHAPPAGGRGGGAPRGDVDLAVDAWGVARAAGGAALATADLSVARAVLGAAAGQAVVQHVLRATNLALVGRTVAVLGHGVVGASVAACVRALGARTVVLEDDARRAAMAALAGHRVASDAQAALAGAELVIACERPPRAGELALPPDGALLAAALPGTHVVAAGAPARPGVARVGRLLAVAAGAPLLTPAGDGLSGEAAELLLALQGVALAALARGATAFPAEAEAAAARTWAARRGAAPVAAVPPAGEDARERDATAPAAPPSRAAGVARIDWARERMPALAAVGRELRDHGALRGRRIALALVLDPTSAALALTLRDAGARVAVHAPPEETHDDVAAALSEAGVAVFARSDGDRTALADALLDTNPELLLDDGAHLIRRVHRERRDALEALVGAAEETTSGVRALRAMEAEGTLAIPCLAVDDARTKRIADNGHATGQSCVLAVLDATGLLLAGRAVAVVGYGPVGRSVAAHAAALGARVTVSEIDPHRALEALHDGHAVAPLLEACASADVVFSATGVPGTVPLPALRALPDGAVVAVAGGVEEEVTVRALRAAARRVERIARAVEAFAFDADGRRVLLVAGGGCVNVTAAEGNPIEAMDCSLALQALAADRLARAAGALTPGVHALPPALDARVARLRLAAAGAATDGAPPEDRRHGEAG